MLEGKTKKRQKVKLHCNAKAYQSILQNPMAKKYQHTLSTDQKTPQTNCQQYLMSSKKNQPWATHADVSPCIYEIDKARHIPTRNYKNNPVVVKPVLITFAKVSVTLQYDKTSIQFLKHGWKNLIPITEATISMKTMKRKREALATFLHVRTVFEHQLNDMYASQNLKKVSFFHSLRARNTFEAHLEPPTSSCINKLH